MNFGEERIILLGPQHEIGKCSCQKHSKIKVFLFHGFSLFVSHERKSSSPARSPLSSSTNLELDGIRLEVSF